MRRNYSGLHTFGRSLAWACDQNDLRRFQYLKWLDLWKLSEIFAAPPQHQLIAVYYFSAYATWLPGPLDRHQRYVRALEARGVTTVMGYFKAKQRHCKLCGRTALTHEEKESDVNAALWMLDGAYRKSYDRALLISRDSDLVPPIRLLHERFPALPVKVIAPPGRRHSERATELAQAHLDELGQLAGVRDRLLDLLGTTRPPIIGRTRW